MYQYQVYRAYKENERAIKSYQKSVSQRVKKVVAESIEERVSDYPDVDNYLRLRFPNVDISDIPIYRANEAIFEKTGWGAVGGLFVPWMELVLIKDKSLGEKTRKPRGRFDKEMMKHSLTADPQDVIVHEMIHAVSHRAQRSSARFTKMEEEFVYTNCIDFYKGRGMNEDQVIDNVFLPFCIMDVKENRSDMDKVLCVVFDSGVETVDFWDLTMAVDSDGRKKLSQFLNNNAEKIVEAIVAAARAKGRQMIDCYHLYGKGMPLPSADQGASKRRFISMGSDL